MSASSYSNVYPIAREYTILMNWHDLIAALSDFFLYEMLIGGNVS